MSNKKKLLIAGIILLSTAHLVIQSLVYAQRHTVTFMFMADQAGNVLLVFLVAWALSRLLALLPYKGRSYRDKYKQLFLVFAFSALCVMVAGLGYVKYRMMKDDRQLNASTTYDNIRIPAELDCVPLRKGSFETETLLIERTENTEVHTDKKNGSKKEYQIQWDSNCQYILTGAESDNKQIRIKIVEINNNTYLCYWLYEEHPRNSPDLLTITIHR